MPKLRRRAPYSTHRRWTTADAEAALSALAASGLSLAGFANREGLVAARLYRWRHRLEARSEAVPSPSAFVELPRRVPERVEIELRSGRVLRVSESIEAGALLRLVDVLEQPC